MVRTAPLALAALATALAGCAGAGPSPPAAERPRTAVERGRAFVQRACAGCHATGAADVSPNGRAPAFRDLAARRSDAELMGSLREISRVGHVEMPPVYVTPDEMAGVVAYLRSLTGRAA